MSIISFMRATTRKSLFIARDHLSQWRDDYTAWQEIHVSEWHTVNNKQVDLGRSEIIEVHGVNDLWDNL